MTRAYPSAMPVRHPTARFRRLTPSGIAAVLVFSLSAGCDREAADDAEAPAGAAATSASPASPASPADEAVTGTATSPSPGRDEARAGAAAGPWAPPPTEAHSELLSAEGSWRVRWAAEPADIPLDALFDVTVAVEPAGGGAVPDDVALALDARMPHHRHGMLVQPTVTRIGPGRFRVEGLMLHMPGYWELHLDVVHRGVAERAQAAFEIDG